MSALMLEQYWFTETGSEGSTITHTEEPAPSLRQMLSDDRYGLSVQQMFDLMFADNAQGLARLQAKQHIFSMSLVPMASSLSLRLNADGCSFPFAVCLDPADIRNGLWRNVAEATQERSLHYSIKVETPLGIKQSDTTDAQTLCWKSSSGFDLDAQVTADGVPYASTFCMSYPSDRHLVGQRNKLLWMSQSALPMHCLTCICR